MIRESEIDRYIPTSCRLQQASHLGWIQRARRGARKFGELGFYENRVCDFIGKLNRKIYKIF